MSKGSADRYQSNHVSNLKLEDGISAVLNGKGPQSQHLPTSFEGRMADINQNDFNC